MKQLDKDSFERYAIFKTGGKQYQAIPGKTIAIEKIPGEVGITVDFPEVLFRKQGEGQFEFGQPFIDGAAVKVSILKHIRGPKLIAFKFGRRKKIRTKKGHRQPITVVRVETI